MNDIGRSVACVVRALSCLVIRPFIFVSICLPPPQTPVCGRGGRRRGATGATGGFPSRNTLSKPPPDWVRIFTSFGRELMGQGAGHGRPGQRVGSCQVGEQAGRNPPFVAVG